MVPSFMFQVCNILVLPFWLIMICLPNWQVTQWFVKSKIIPVILGIVYLAYIFHLFSVGNFSNFTSLEGIKQLFVKDEILLAGWVHYLAFDAFVGGWMLQNSQTRHMPHYLLAPALILTFFLGPIGLLFYLGVRIFYAPQINVVL